MPHAPLPLDTSAIQVPTLYLRALMELTQEMGVEPQTWLQAADISPQHLALPTVALSTARYLAMVHSLMQHTQEPALGLLLGQRLRMNTHGTLAFAVMNSGSLRQAIQLVEHFLPLRTNLITVCFNESGACARLHFTPAADLGAAELLILETVMLAVRNVFDYLAPGTQTVLAVEFAAPVTRYQPLAQELFACSVHYNATTSALYLNPQTLDTPFFSADAQSLANAAAMCQAELDASTARESLTARIQRSMLGASGALPSLQACARILHMAPRTLHRRLEAEDTSYRTIIDQVRHRLALQYLKNSAFSLQEIAYRLGYTDQANFRRAFKRWEGVAPSALR